MLARKHLLETGQESVLSETVSNILSEPGYRPLLEPVADILPEAGDERPRAEGDCSALLTW